MKLKARIKAIGIYVLKKLTNENLGGIELKNLNNCILCKFMDLY